MMTIRRKIGITQIMVAMGRIELPTRGSSNRRSTIELHSRIFWVIGGTVGITLNLDDKLFLICRGALRKPAKVSYQTQLSLAFNRSLRSHNPR